MRHLRPNLLQAGLNLSQRSTNFDRSNRYRPLRRAPRLAGVAEAVAEVVVDSVTLMASAVTEVVVDSGTLRVRWTHRLKRRCALLLILQCGLPAKLQDLHEVVCGFPLLG